MGTSAVEPGCSFCGRARFDVRHLVTGATANICDECVDVCADTINKHRKDALPRGAELPPPAMAPVWPSGPAVSCSLCRLPSPVNEMLLVENKGALCRECVLEVDALTADSLWNKR
jgi:ClpX C4-type zinc finger protein